MGKHASKNVLPTFHTPTASLPVVLPLEFMHRLAARMNRILTAASRQDHAVTYNEPYFSLESDPR